MSFLDQLFKKPKASSTADEDARRAAALREAGLASDAFIAGGAPIYDQGQQYIFNELGQLEQLGPSAMQGIQTDPRLIQAQFDALRELETRGREGFTARDELDRLKSKQMVGKENAGRIGAIQQNMAARGMGGSGLDLVAQMQAAQAATDREALAALERNAAQEANRSNASAQAGQLAGSVRNQAFNENASKAQAQDLINRFNTQNSINRQQYNNQGINRTNAANVDRANQVTDMNTQGRYGFRKDALGVRQGQQQMNYNAATEDLNQKRIKDQQRMQAHQAKISGLSTLAGAGVGAMFGNPMLGAQIGNAAGGAFYAKGGKVPDGDECYASGGYVNAPEIVPWDDEVNDIKQINVSGGEIVIPKSIANDPIASARFVDQENRKAIGKARETQDMYGLANVLGKAATDYGNSKNPDVILANRMQDLGQAPSVYKSEKRQYDSSVLDSLGNRAVGRASEDATRNERAFARDAAIRDRAAALKEDAALKDPSSPESIAARDVLLNLAPDIRKRVPNFDQLTAKSLANIAPGYFNLSDMRQKAANRAQDFELEQQKLQAHQANTQAQLDLKKALDERDRAETSNKREFDNLPEDSKRTITSLSSKNADKEAIASQIEAVMSNWDNLTEAQKLQQGSQLIKTLNSTQGADAVGAEEARRLAGKLEFSLGNFFNSNPTQFGRNLKGFKEDADLTVKAIRDSMISNQKVIDKAYGRQENFSQTKGASGSWEDY